MNVMLPSYMEKEICYFVCWIPSLQCSRIISSHRISRETRDRGGEGGEEEEKEEEEEEGTGEEEEDR